MSATSKGRCREIEKGWTDNGVESLVWVNFQKKGQLTRTKEFKTTSNLK